VGRKFAGSFDSLMRAFLTAEWRYLLMLNYAVEPDLLRPHVPNGIELDTWNGNAYVSMVGFLFLHTRVLGVRMPGHGNFEEVNLRFYVRRRAPEGWRRGVVFIKEVVPRQLIAAVARLYYNEPYEAMPMRHAIDTENGTLKSGGAVEYGWRSRNGWNFLRVATVGIPQATVAGSQEEFITEHYWGYTAQKNGRCKEYRMDHVRWNVWQTEKAVLQCDTASLYGAKFSDPLQSPPQSAFVAEGSPVIVGSGVTI
jgi:uncharacterized protein YqjF (DUF2071 family)